MTTPARRFRAEILAEGRNAWVRVPPGIGEAFSAYATARRIPIVGRVRGVTFHTTMMPAAGGGHRLYINLGTRKHAGVDVGDRVRIEVRPLREPGTDTPADLETALGRDEAARAAFEAAPSSQCRELIRYIEDAENPRTRRRRIEESIASLLGPLPKKKSHLKTKPLWTCPRCGHSYVNVNQYHSCHRYELADVLGDKPEWVRGCFEKLRKMVLANGPAEMQVYRDRIAFMVRVRFAGASPKKRWLDVGFWLTRRIEHPRFARIETITPDVHVHRIRITDADQLDDEVAAWLAESYAVGCQQHLE